MRPPSGTPAWVSQPDRRPSRCEASETRSRQGPARRVRIIFWPFSAASTGLACQGHSARQLPVHTRLSWQSAENGQVGGPVPPASSCGWYGRSSNPSGSPGIPGILQPRSQGKPDSLPDRPSCSTSPPLQPVDALASAGERFRVYFHSSYRTQDPCRASRQPVSPGADSRSGGTGGQEQCRRLIRLARLEPLALSAAGHERTVNGRAAASGEERIDLSAGIVHPVAY